MPMKQDFTKYQAGDPPEARDLKEEVIVSPDTQRPSRLPPGQVRTRKWPILHYGKVPNIPLDEWRLEVTGLVERPLTLNWTDWLTLPRVRVFADFHCVTRWSRLGNVWEGVAARELLSRAGPMPAARFIIAHAYDDPWTTNLSMEDFGAPDVLLADKHDGATLSADHGGPVRLMVPRLYAWKSAKWIHRLELVAQDQPGYWERAGYHHRGDPWSEERYGW